MKLFLSTLQTALFMAGISWAAIGYGNATTAPMLTHTAKIKRIDANADGTIYLKMAEPAHDNRCKKSTWFGIAATNKQFYESTRAIALTALKSGTTVKLNFSGACVPGKDYFLLDNYISLQTSEELNIGKSGDQDSDRSAL